MVYKFARFLQLLALLILPAAVAGEIAERLTLKESLYISGLGAGCFVIGYLLQQTTRPR
jgi:ABC-type Mn2+/Zn2+ transport system permease subunit